MSGRLNLKNKIIKHGAPGGGKMGSPPGGLVEGGGSGGVGGFGGGPKGSGGFGGGGPGVPDGFGAGAVGKSGSMGVVGTDGLIAELSFSAITKIMPATCFHHAPDGPWPNGSTRLIGSLFT